MAISQILNINWGPPLSIPMWMYILSLYMMYAVAYPVGNSAVLGLFSVLQKTGKQAKMQSDFALMGSLARVIFPIICSYMEKFIEPTGSFGVVLILMSVSVVLVMLCHQRIVHFTVDSFVPPVDNCSTYSRAHIGMMVASCVCIAASIGAILDWGQPGW